MKKKLIIALIIIFVIAIIIYGIFYIRNMNKVAVLCYHNIATAEEKSNFPDESEFVIDVNNFEEHLKFFKRNTYKTLTMDEFNDWKQGKLKIPQNSVLITFDDGFLSNYQYAFPLLKKYNMNATVFVVGKYAAESKETEWNGNVKTYMPANLILKLKDEYPNIDICSHSYDLHYRESLKENNADEVHDDAVLYSALLGDTKYFAYPFGEYNNALINGLKDYNYELAFIYGPNKHDYRKASLNDDNFKIPRLNVSSGMEIWKLALRLWVWD